MKYEPIKNKVWNIDVVVEEIKNFPQTYDTILQHENSNGTLQTILRRKLNRLCMAGIICKTNIPGTRFGKAIFYCIPKEYHILVEAGRIGSEVYCFFKYEKISKFYIKLSEYWALRGGLWIKETDKTVFQGNVLKWL